MFLFHLNLRPSTQPVMKCNHKVYCCEDANCLKTYWNKYRHLYICDANIAEISAILPFL